jgi:hypothetical protein
MILPIATRRNLTGSFVTGLSPRKIRRSKMRSTIVKAALAALLVSTPLTAAFAASTSGHKGHSSGMHTRSDQFRGGNRDTGANWNAEDNGYSTYAPNGQLNAILYDLGNAKARITYDRSQRLITPAQANGLRAEATSIRRNAIADDRGGAIPMWQYRQLVAQVENLQSQL